MLGIGNTKGIIRYWYLLLPTVIITLLGIVLSEVQDYFGLQKVLLGLVMTLLILVSVFSIIGKLIQEIESAYLADLPKLVADEISDFVDQYYIGEKPGIPGVITDQMLSEFERSVNVSEIWLVSFDLQTEFGGGVYPTIVRDNLIRGIKYTYFVQRQPGIETKIERSLLNKLDTKAKTNLRIVLIDDDFFFLVSNLDIVIYEPRLSNGSGRLAYISVFLKDCDTVYEAPLAEDVIDIITAKLKGKLNDGGALVSNH